MLDQLLQQATLSLQASDFQQALRLSQQALQLAPQHPHAQFIQAIALGNSNQLQKSVKIMNRLIQAHPGNPEMHYNLALIYQVNSKIEEAIVEYKKCLNAHPQHIMALNNLALQLLQIGNYPGAINYFRETLKLSPNNPGMVFNLAYALNKDNQIEASLEVLAPLLKSNQPPIETKVLFLKNQLALGHYQSAYEQADQWPNQTVCFFYKGLAAIKMYQYPLAVAALTQYHKHHPDDSAGVMNLALALAYAGNTAQADQLVDHLLASGSPTVEIYEFCARLYDMRHMTDQSSEHIEQGLQLDPNNSYLQTLSASHQRKQKNYEEALQSLNTVIESVDDPRHRSAALFEKGKCLDAMQHYDKAWKSFSLANQLIHQNKPSHFFEQLNAENELISQAQIQLKPIQEIIDAHQQIFVIGFPRSGTTLIDSILNSYAETTVLEEIPILDHLSDQLFSQHASQKHRVEILAQLNESEKQLWRRNYFDQLSRYIHWNQDKTLINKSPLNIIHLPLIHTLFPDHPIIMGIRHPLDSVLSCYTQHFQSHALLGDVFSDLTQVTQTYNQLMKYWQSCQQILAIPSTVIQYEEMVTNFDSESKKLVSACQLPWRQDLQNFYRSNADRGIIQNPSSDQVNQPLYTSSLHRHHNYAQHLQSSEKALQHWINFFGYA